MGLMKQNTCKFQYVAEGDKFGKHGRVQDEKESPSEKKKRFSFLLCHVLWWDEIVFEVWESYWWQQERERSCIFTWGKDDSGVCCVLFYWWGRIVDVRDMFAASVCWCYCWRRKWWRSAAWCGDEKEKYEWKVAAIRSFQQAFFNVKKKKKAPRSHQPCGVVVMELWERKLSEDCCCEENLKASSENQPPLMLIEHFMYLWWTPKRKMVHLCYLWTSFSLLYSQ